MSKRVIILGANSFLARNLYKYLIDKSENTQYEILLYDKDDQHIDGAKKYFKVDFFNEESIKTINFDCSVIYLFIGKTGTVSGFKDYKLFININELVLLNILTAYCEKKSTAKIVYPSTRLVYKGDMGIKVDEDADKQFKSIYAITKYASENYLKLYSDVFGVKFCILRICAPYGTLLDFDGNYGTFELFTNMAKSGKDITVYGDGSITKTYTHISDICYIMDQCGSLDYCTNEIFNVGGDSMSLQQIALLISEKFGVSIKNIDWPECDRLIDGGSTVFDSSKLDKILNYTYQKIVI